MNRTTTLQPLGVQDLIDRIREEGVKAAREEAGRIVREAERQAAEIVAEARREADELRARAHADIEAEQTAAREALKLSARDTILHLESRVLHTFERFVRHLVAEVTCDECFVRDLILVLAGHAAEEFIRDRDAKIFVAETLFGDQAGGRLSATGKRFLLSLASDMLRAGVELIPASDVHGGARVRLVDERLEIDLTDEAVARLLSERLLPRFRDLLEGIE